MIEKSKKDELLIECGIIFGKDGTVSIKRDTKKTKYQKINLAIDGQIELLTTLKISLKEHQKLVDLLTEIDDYINVIPVKTFTNMDSNIKNEIISKLAIVLYFKPDDSVVNSQIIEKIKNIHDMFMIRNLPAAWASAKSTKRILKKLIEKLIEKIEITSKTIVVLENID